eukprot:COSAG05_NODE_3934_length_1767_cov_1.594724_2_plen_179_part_00
MYHRFNEELRTVACDGRRKCDTYAPATTRMNRKADTSRVAADALAPSSVCSASSAVCNVSTSVSTCSGPCEPLTAAKSCLSPDVGSRKYQCPLRPRSQGAFSQRVPRGGEGTSTGSAARCCSISPHHTAKASRQTVSERSLVTDRVQRSRERYCHTNALDYARHVNSVGTLLGVPCLK